MANKLNKSCQCDEKDIDFETSSNFLSTMTDRNPRSELSLSSPSTSGWNTITPNLSDETLEILNDILSSSSSESNLRAETSNYGVEKWETEKSEKETIASQSNRVKFEDKTDIESVSSEDFEDAKTSLSDTSSEVDGFVPASVAQLYQMELIDELTVDAIWRWLDTYVDHL